MTYLFISTTVLLAIVLVLVVYLSYKHDEKQSETIFQLTKRLSKAEEACKDINHSLNLSVINEVSRIEQNVRLMDYRVKGVSNISNRVLSLKSIFSSLGYEIPELAGKPYNKSDNHEVTLQLDDTLAPGETVIKKVVRPTVLFNGKLIQAASVIVSYNDSPSIS